MTLNAQGLDWKKSNGLLPAIVQHAQTGVVLMLGHMDQAALHKTLESGLVTFFSRSKNRLWTKGESSGNTLALVDIVTDCDQDALLVFARPCGPVCHAGTDTCFDQATQQSDWGFIMGLEATILERQRNGAPTKSHTAQLLAAGTGRAAQKVGEEAVEVVIAALQDTDAALCAEVADLFYHLMVLLRSRGLSLSEALQVLKARKR